MKINKKMINLMAALAIAVPMSVSVGALNNIYADSIPTLIVDSSDNKPVADITLAFYSVTNNTAKKVFTVKTNSLGKLDKSTVVAYNSFDTSAVVDDNGNLNLKDGTYYYIDEAVVDGYIKNVKPVRFTVLNGVAPSIDRAYKKMSMDKSQLIINTTDNLGNPIEGATLDLYKYVNGNYVRLAALTTDSDGLMLDVIDRTSEDSSTVIETSNGTLILPKGSYKIVPKNTSTNLKPVKSESIVEVGNGKVVSLAISYSKDNSGSSNKGQNASDVKTGVKILVRSKNTNKPLENQEIAVYSLDADGKNEKLIFVGKTNGEGIFESSKVTKGSELLGNNGALALEPGKYYYKLNNYSGAKQHPFTVVEGKVSQQVLTLNIENNNNTKSSSYSTTTNNGSNITKSSSLAKVGS